MVQRQLEQEAEKFLTEYGAAILNLNKEYPEGEDYSVRMWALQKLRNDGIKRIKGLIAEFGILEASWKYK